MDVIQRPVQVRRLDGEVMPVGQILRPRRLAYEGGNGVDARLPQHLAVIGGRPLAARGVDLAAIGQGPGIGRQRLPILAVAHPADTGLADVIDRRPDEIADHPGHGFHRPPILEGVLGRGLGGQHDPVGELDMVGAEQMGAVVVARHVQHGELAGVVRPVDADRLGHGSAGVQAAHALGQPPARLRPLRRALLRYLVADAPEQHAGMVAAADHQAVEVGRPILREEAGVVLGALGLVPGVERLVDDQHAQRVGGVQRRLAGGVVGAADGVVAGGLHQRDLTRVRVGQAGGADHVIVVVDVAALQHHLSAVDAQALARVDGEGADAEAGAPLILQRAAHAHLLHQGVEIGRVGGPQRRPVHHERLVQIRVAVGRHRPYLPRLGHHGAVGRHHLGLQFDRRRVHRPVHHRRPHRHLSPLRRRHRRGDGRALRVKVDGVQDVQADRADQAGAGVPARRRIGMVDPHGDDIVTGAHLARQIEAEGGVAIAMPRHRLAIQPDVGIHVDGFEIQADDAGRPRRVQHQVPAVPGLPPRQVTGVLPGDRLRVEGRRTIGTIINGSVVGNGDRPPVLVIEGHGPGARRLAAVDAPAGYQGQLFRPRAGGQDGEQRRQRQDAAAASWHHSDSLGSPWARLPYHNGPLFILAPPVSHDRPARHAAGRVDRACDSANIHAHLSE
ncbi:hypothetical protein AZA_58047 [Nitrospirillum viridazoti Y2]|nr:hypothetical protein AZA_58047 [Nitrospirillum amazonense Y2]